MKNKKTEAETARRSRRRLQQLVRLLASMTCPFCGQKEIYVYPATQDRPWWVVGCQSVVCDSSWHIDKNCGQTALEMLKRAQPKECQVCASNVKAFKAMNRKPGA